MTIDKNNLSGEYHADVGGLLAEIERLARFEDWFVRLDQAEQSLSASFKAERDQLKAENEALRNLAAGKIICDLDLFEDLRDSAAEEAAQYRQAMGSIRPHRQEALDDVVRRCDELINLAKAVSHD